MAGSYPYGNAPTVNLQGWNADKADFAFLALFGPKNIPDITIRPYVYNFTTGFIDVVHETINNATNSIYRNMGTGNTYTSGLENLTKYYDADKIVTPDANGVLFSGRHLADNWTFFLTIDNSSIRGRSLSSKTSNRLIYTGFCLDEPVHLDHGGKPIINPRCIFYPTYFSKINVQSMYGSNGNITTSRPEVVNDLVPNVLTPQFSNGRKYLARPCDLLPSSDVSFVNDPYMDNTYRTLGDYSRLDLTDDVITHVNANYNNPITHSNLVLNAVVDTVLDDVSEKITRTNYGPAYTGQFASEDFLSSNKYNRFTDHLKDVVGDRMIGIDTNKPISFQQLVEQLPSLMYADNITVYAGRFETPVFTNGQGSNPINIATSLLQQTIPTIVKNCGLSEMDFRYATFNSASVIKIDNDYSCDITSARSVTDFDSVQTTQIKCRAAIKEMESQVFKLIKMSYGNFDVIVHYSLGGVCSVLLQLPDMVDVTNVTPLTFNDVISGLTSPVVSTEGLCINNLNALGTAMDLTASNVPVHQNNHNRYVGTPISHTEYTGYNSTNNVNFNNQYTI